MTLAQWCMAAGSVRRHQQRIFKLFAFLGRYAHQQKSDMMRDTTRDLMRMATATNDLLADEKRDFDNSRSVD